jgi:hypothetical protein
MFTEVIGRAATILAFSSNGRIKRIVSCSVIEESFDNIDCGGSNQYDEYAGKNE